MNLSLPEYVVRRGIIDSGELPMQWRRGMEELSFMFSCANCFFRSSFSLIAFVLCTILMVHDVYSHLCKVYIYTYIH